MEKTQDNAALFHLGLDFIFEGNSLSDVLLFLLLLKVLKHSRQTAATHAMYKYSTNNHTNKSQEKVPQMSTSKESYGFLQNTWELVSALKTSLKRKTTEQQNFYFQFVPRPTIA